MKIVGKTKDYYDGVMISDDPLWVRKHESFVFNDKRCPLSREEKDEFKGLLNVIPEPKIKHKLSGRTVIHDKLHRTVIVGFCGKLHIIYLMYSGDTPLPEFIGCAQKPSEFVDKFNKHNKHHKTELEDIGDFVWRKPFHDGIFENVYEYGNYNSFVMEISMKIKSPIFSVSRINGNLVININPVLKDIGFQSVVDPWMAYQKIEQFVGGVLTNTEIDDFAMSDKLKLASKGMDEWSFKQRGPKKRKLKKGLKK